MGDSQCRKYQLTINNQAEKNLDHDNIKRILSGLKSLVYYCMADEIGLETHTPHTHIFIAAKSAIRFSRIKKLFPSAHIEPVRGSCEENRDYIRKDGKWAEDSKADTSVPGTFEEWGELPDEPGPGHRSDIENMYEMIENGMTNAEIMSENPKLAMYIGKMDKIRQEIMEARFRDQRRDLDVTYIFGPTETGKTRGVMEKHGYSNVYRVTDYFHPFDRYQGQPVMCFDEFRSSLMIGDMLQYLDGYPLALPARYAPRQAQYETVYLISNIDLSMQYKNVQENEPATWRAFLRRIHHVIEYRQTGPPVEHGNATDYIYPPPPPVPDWVRDAEAVPDIEQIPF